MKTNLAVLPALVSRAGWGHLARTLSVLVLMLAGPAGAAGMEIRVPRPESPRDDRSVYEIELLRLVLKQAGVTASIRLADAVMTQEQVVQSLQQGDGVVRLAWFMTSAQREQALLPVRFPIDKGLLGWRISLVKADRFDRFRSVRDVRGLRKYTAVQGLGWPDVEVLQFNGLRVLNAVTYEQAFSMVAEHKADYFPRSLIEYRTELEHHRDEGLVEEPYMVLRYPAAAYFFLARSDTVLADKLKDGLEKALRDGSFDRLFYLYHSQFIEAAGLERRHVVELANPDFGDKALLARKALWFRPETMR